VKLYQDADAATLHGGVVLNPAPRERRAGAEDVDPPADARANVIGDGTIVKIPRAPGIDVKGAAIHHAVAAQVENESKI